MLQVLKGSNINKLSATAATAIFIVLLGGMLMRTLIFEQENFLDQGDECFSLDFAVKINSKLLVSKIPSSYGMESNGILYYYFLHCFINNNTQLTEKIQKAGSEINDHTGPRLNEADIQIVHFTSYFFSIISIFLVYLTGRRLQGIKTGIFAALFFALNGTVMLTASYCRFYQLNIFSCCLASYLLVILIDSEKKLLFGTLYAIALVMCISSMMCSVFIIPAHFLYWVFRKKSLKKLLPIIAIPLLIFIMLWAADSGALGRKGTYGDASFELFSTYINWIFGINTETTPPYQNSLFNLFKYLLNVSYLAALIISALIIFKPHQLKRASRSIGSNMLNAIVFASLWASMPLLIMFAFSISFTNIIKIVNLSFICPGTALLLGSLAAASSKHLRYFILAITAICAPLFICDYNFHEKWDTLKYLKQHTMINDIIGCDQSMKHALDCSGLKPFRYYNVKTETPDKAFTDKKSFTNAPHHLWIIWNVGHSLKKDDNDKNSMEDIYKNELTNILIKQNCIPKIYFRQKNSAICYAAILEKNIDTVK